MLEPSNRADKAAGEARKRVVLRVDTAQRIAIPILYWIIQVDSALQMLNRLTEFSAVSH